MAAEVAEIAVATPAAFVGLDAHAERRANGRGSQGVGLARAVQRVDAGGADGVAALPGVGEGDRRVAVQVPGSAVSISPACRTPVTAGSWCSPAGPHCRVGREPQRGGRRHERAERSHGGGRRPERRAPAGWVSRHVVLLHGSCRRSGGRAERHPPPPILSKLCRRRVAGSSRCVDISWAARWRDRQPAASIASRCGAGGTSAASGEARGRCHGEDDHELLDAVVDPLVIAGLTNTACAAFIARLVAAKSAMVRCSETKCTPAWPSSTVSKSRRRMRGAPPTRVFVLAERG